MEKRFTSYENFALQCNIISDFVYLTKPCFKFGFLLYSQERKIAQVITQNYQILLAYKTCLYS